MAKLIRLLFGPTLATIPVYKFVTRTMMSVDRIGGASAHFLCVLEHPETNTQWAKKANLY